MKKPTMLLITGLCALAFGQSALASFMVQLEAGDPTPSGSYFEYTYELVFSPASGFTLQDGDFATIYDFSGLVSATAPPGFTVSLQNSGIDAAGIIPVDSLTLPNLTFTRTGGAVTTADTFLATVVSSYGLVSLKSFTAQETSATGLPSGTIGGVSVPTVPVAQVPEPPAAALLFLAGVLVMIGQKRRACRPASK